MLFIALILFGIADTLFGLRARLKLPPAPPLGGARPPFNLTSDRRSEHMEVILLERVAKLGQMGDTVRVKDGFARNFLLPRGKALRATKDNKARFETERAQLEARNLERRTEAEAVADKLDGQSFVIIRQAGETGVLYGSVSTRDLAETMTAGGFTVEPRAGRAQRADQDARPAHRPGAPAPRGRGQGDDQRRPQPRGGRAPGARRDRHRPARRPTSTTSASRSARRLPKPAPAPRLEFVLILF